ncbi:MAG TPA: hypothetical protein VGR25_04860 [bacterium]|jgi:hypothetical protein|nr:hypothetical protein [bacterium]
MRLLAVLIAAAFALIGLVPLARSAFRQPTFWVMVVIGAFVVPIAQLVTRTVWEPAAVGLGLPQIGVGLGVTLLVTALVGEVFKVAPVLIVGAMTEAPPRDWFAYGAAAGAGFGLFAEQQIIGFALEVARLAFSTPLSTPATAAVAIAFRFFPILAHTATTAFVAWAASRGWLGRGLIIATLVHLLLGVIERGQGSLGTLLARLLFGAVAVFLFLSVWSLRDQPQRRPSRLPAG